MDKDEKAKYDTLLEDRKKISEKLDYLYKGFRGVSHENSAAEMRYTTIKVYEAHLISIEKAIEEIEKKK